VKLGIFPGFGGSVRMPRLVGVDNAVEWIATGADKKPDAALKDGVVDAVVTPEQLRDAALALVKQALAGKLDWQGKRAERSRRSSSTRSSRRWPSTARWRWSAASRPELSGSDAGTEEHAGSGHQGPRRGARVEAKYFAKAA